MKLSARNILNGKVIEVTKGQTTAHVKIDIAHGAWSPRRSPTRRSTSWSSRSATRPARSSRPPTSWSASRMAIERRHALPLAARRRCCVCCRRPRPQDDAHVTDAAGRQVAGAGARRARLRGGPAGRDPPLHARAGQAARLDQRVPRRPSARSSRSATPTCRRSAGSPGAATPPTSRSCWRAKPDVDLRLRLGRPDLRVARRPRAAADRHSVPAARRRVRPHRRTPTRCSAICSATGARGDELAAYVARHARRDRPRVARVPPRARPRVYYAPRPERPRDRARRLDQRRDHRARRRGQRRRRAMGGGGLVQVSIEQVLAWDPEMIVTIDPDLLRAVSRSDPLWQNVAAVREPARLPVAQACRSAGSTSRRRSTALIGLRWLARMLYPDAVPRGPRGRIARDFYTLLLSPGADRRAARRACWRDAERARLT